MPNLIDNLIFEHLDKFQAYSSSVCEKVESHFFLKKGILQIKWKTGRNNLINTWLALLYKQNILKIKHNSPDSIQKCVDELIC